MNRVQYERNCNDQVYIFIKHSVVLKSEYSTLILYRTSVLRPYSRRSGQTKKDIGMNFSGICKPSKPKENVGMTPLCHSWFCRKSKFSA